LFKERRPKFIDLYNSIIAYILEDDTDKFYIFDVGVSPNENRGID
jgi:hypothetical protein